MRPDEANPPPHFGTSIGGVVVDVVITPNEVDPKLSDMWVEITRPEWDWAIAYRVVPGEGTLSISEVRIFPQQKTWYFQRWPGTFDPSTPTPPGGLSRRWLRDYVATGEHIDLARFYLEKILEPLSEESAEVRRLTAGVRKLGFSALEVGEHPEKGKSLLWWARLVAAYVDLVEQGSKRPVADLAEKFDMPTSSVRDYLHRARYQGQNRPKLLTRPASGRAGGKLTDEAIEILRKAPPRPSKARPPRRSQALQRIV